MLLLYSPHHYLQTERFIYFCQLSWDWLLALLSSHFHLSREASPEMYLWCLRSLCLTSSRVLSRFWACLCGHVCTVICMNVHICILSPEDVWTILILKEKTFLVRNLLPGCFWSLCSLLQLPILWFCLSGRGLGFLVFAHLFCLSSPGPHPHRSAADLVKPTW